MTHQPSSPGDTQQAIVNNLLGALSRSATRTDQAASPELIKEKAQMLAKKLQPLIDKKRQELAKKG